MIETIETRFTESSCFLAFRDETEIKRKYVAPLQALVSIVRINIQILNNLFFFNNFKELQLKCPNLHYTCTYKAISQCSLTKIFIFLRKKDLENVDGNLGARLKLLPISFLVKTKYNLVSTNVSPAVYKLNIYLVNQRLSSMVVFLYNVLRNKEETQLNSQRSLSLEASHCKSKRIKTKVGLYNQHVTIYCCVQ